MKFNYLRLSFTFLLVLLSWIIIIQQNIESAQQKQRQEITVFTLINDPGVSFQQDVIPIIKTKCNLDDCHGERGFPKFYTHRILKAKAKKIKKRITAEIEPMPPKDSPLQLTKLEIKTLNDWVDAGAPNN